HRPGRSAAGTAVPRARPHQALARPALRRGRGDERLAAGAAARARQYRWHRANDETATDGTDGDALEPILRIGLYFNVVAPQPRERRIRITHQKKDAAHEY